MRNEFERHLVKNNLISFILASVKYLLAFAFFFCSLQYKISNRWDSDLWW